MSRSLVIIVLSITVAMIAATGMLTLGLAVAAAARGQNLVELYQEIFPQVRGVPVPFRAHAAAYGVFFGYVVGAAEIAIICRRRIGARLR